MKTIKSYLLAGFCSLMGAANSLWAATHICTFKDFSVLNTEDGVLRSGGYTVTLGADNIVGTGMEDGGNGIAKGAVRIGSSAPLLLTRYDTWGSNDPGITVILKYSELAQTSDRAIITTSGDGLNSKVGLSVNKPADSNAIASGIWNGGMWNNTGNNISKNAISAEGYLVFVYQSTSSHGVTVYDGTGNSTIFSAAGLKASNSQTGAAVCIGGTYANNFLATGLVVEAVTIYRGALTQNEVATAVANQESFTVHQVSDTNLTATEINTLLGTGQGVLRVPNGTTITLDVPLTGSPIVACVGNVTITADSQPSATELAKLDCSQVEGVLKRSWFTTTSLGVNFNATNAEDVSAALVAGGAWTHTTSNNGLQMLSNIDGLTSVEWSSNNVWFEGGNNGTPTEGSIFTQGYLDDGGKGAHVTVSGVPYLNYDLYIYAETDNGVKFSCKTVNGENYSWDAENNRAVHGSTDGWGDPTYAVDGKTKPALGENVIWIQNLNAGTLIIDSIRRDANNQNVRGSISAIQIVNAEDRLATIIHSRAEVTGDTLFSALNATPEWANGETNTIELDNIAESATVTLDGTLSGATLSVVSEEGCDLTLVKATDASVAFDWYDFSKALGKVTLGFDPGEDVVITTGADMTFTVNPTGTINISEGTETITYRTTETLPGLPYNTAGNMASTIVIAGKVVSTDTVNDSTAIFNNKKYLIAEGGDVTLAKLNLGNQGNKSQSMTIDGGTMTITGDTPSNTTGDSSTGDSVLLGHWAGNDIHLNVLEGEFKALNAVSRLGWTGGCQIVIGGKEDEGTTALMHLKGIQSHNASSSLTILTNGTLKVDSVGILFAQTAWTMAGGVVETTSDTIIQDTHADGIHVTADSTIQIAPSSTLTLKSTITGDGKLSFVSDGYATVDFGLSRPSQDTPLAFDGGIDMRFSFVDKADIIYLKTTSTLSTDNVSAVYAEDTNEDVDITVEQVYVNGSATGVYEIKPTLPVWTNTNGNGSFTDPNNWSSGYVPTADEIIVEVSGEDETEISSLQDIYAYTAIYLRGEGAVRFDMRSTAGFAENTVIHIPAGMTLILDGTKFTNGYTCNLILTGAGKVVTRGNVTMSKANTFTGGLIVESGSILQTTAQQGYGGSGAASGNAYITVKNGGAVDIATTQNYCYAYTIEGKGYQKEDGSYSGALYNTGAAQGEGERQTWKITLTDDALITADSGHHWGILNNSWYEAFIFLNGHTLTKQGTATFFVSNTTISSGSGGHFRVLDGVLKTREGQDSRFHDTHLSIEKTGRLQLQSKLSNLLSLTFKAGLGGVGFTGISNYDVANPRPVVNAAWIEPKDITPGAELTLVTDSEATGFTNGLFVVRAGGRFETAEDSAETAVVNPDDPKYVKVTARDLRNFYHYDFDGLTADTAKADDSTYGASGVFSDVEGVAGSELIQTRNGHAAKIYYTTDTQRYNPLWTSSSAGYSPFDAGIVTVTTVVKPVDAADGKIIWGLGDVWNAPHYSVALVSENDNTLSVVKWTARAPCEVLATVTGIKDLTRAYHFVAVEFAPEGTTLRVGNKSNATTKTAPYPIAIHTQFGTVYGGAPEGDKRAGTECYIDDWQLFDARLTDEELRNLRMNLAPPPFILRFR